MAYYMNDVTEIELARRVKRRALSVSALMIDDIKVGSVYTNNEGELKYISMDLPNGASVNARVVPTDGNKEAEIGQG